MSETSSKKRKLSLPLVLAGGVSSLVLALGMSPTFSAFTAQITNTLNTAGTGTLIMQEVGPGGTCLSTDNLPTGNTLGNNNTASCVTNNKYGGTTTLLVPGGALATTKVTITNVGTLKASTFTLTGGACAQTGTNGTTTDMCAKMNIKVYAAATATGTPIYTGTAAGLAGVPTTITGGLNAGSSQDFTFTVGLDTSAGNPYQGLGISQPLIWNFQA